MELMTIIGYGFGLFLLAAIGGLFVNAWEKIGIFSVVLPVISLLSYGTYLVGNHFECSFTDKIWNFTVYWFWGWVVLFVLLIKAEKVEMPTMGFWDREREFNKKYWRWKLSHTGKKQSGM